MQTIGRRCRQLGMAVAMAGVVGGCVTVLPRPPYVNVTPLNRILEPGRHRQEDVRRTMGREPDIVVRDVKLTSDGRVPRARAAGLDNELCVFPEMNVFRSVTVWQYTDVVLVDRATGPDVRRSACFVFLHTNWLLRFNESVSQ